MVISITKFSFVPVAVLVSLSQDTLSPNGSKINLTGIKVLPLTIIGCSSKTITSPFREIVISSVSANDVETINSINSMILRAFFIHASNLV